MANTFVIYTGDGVQTDFPIPFSKLDPNFVKISVEGVDTAFTYISDSVARITPAPAAGAAVRVFRETQRDSLIVEIPTSGLIRGADINDQSQQVLDIASEAFDQLDGVMAENFAGDLDAEGRRIINVGAPVGDSNAATKLYVDTIMDADRAEIDANKTAAAASAAAALASQNAAATSATNAGNSASAASTSAGNAASSATLASDWASKAEDSPVVTGKYSAFNWAQKAAASATAAAASAAAAASVVLGNFATLIHAATSKATPVDADEFGIADSAASFGLKKLTWANLKATLKTYFDSLYTYASQGVIPDAQFPARLSPAIGGLLTDANTATANGWWRGNSTTANMPTGSDYLIEAVVHISNLWVTQTAIGFVGATSANSLTYRRHMQNGTWQPWYKLQIAQGEQDARYAAFRTTTISSAAPSGGANGDIWFQV